MPLLLQVLSADALWARSKPRLRRQRSSLSKVLAVSLMKKRRSAACVLVFSALQLRVPWETRSLRRRLRRRRVWVCGVMVVVVAAVTAVVVGAVVVEEGGNTRVRTNL